MLRLVRGAAGAAVVPVVVAGLWHMNETSGTVMADSSGNGNDGALYNVTLGTAGKYGTSYTFSGKSSYVEVPTPRR